MIYALAALPFIASTFILWRKNMDLLPKLNAALAAADGVAAKLAAKDAEIATLKANQADQALEQQIADGLDAITAKLSG